MTKILSTILLFAPLLVAQGPDVHFDAVHTSIGGHKSLQNHLSLSDEQMQQFESLRRDQFERMRPVIEQMGEKQRALDEALKAASPDPALVGRLTIELQQLRQAMPDAREALREQALAILSTGQRAQLDNLRDALQLHATATQAVSLNLLDTDYSAMPGGHESIWIGDRSVSLTGDVTAQSSKGVYLYSGPAEDVRVVEGKVVTRKKRLH